MCKDLVVDYTFMVPFPHSMTIQGVHDYTDGGETIIASFPANIFFSFPCHSPFGGKYSLKLVLGYFAEKVRWSFS